MLVLAGKSSFFCSRKLFKDGLIAPTVFQFNSKIQIIFQKIIDFIIFLHNILLHIVAFCYYNDPKTKKEETKLSLTYSYVLEIQNGLLHP